MNQEERAEARHACTVRHETAPEAFLAQNLLAALDALEAAERERDEAQAKLANLHFMHDGRLIDLERARAQVETLAKMLNDRRDADRDNADRARDALKAAGAKE